jgi:hypothetical protein
MGLADARQIERGERHAEQRHDDEGDPPAEKAGEDAAEQGREPRRSRPDDHGQRQRPPERLAVEEVARDGPRQDGSRAGPQRLNDPAEDQYRQDVGHRADDAAHGEDRESSQDERLAAEAVGERPDHELSQGEGDEEAAQQEAKLRRGDRQVAADYRKGRQDDVGGEGADRRQAGEKEQNPLADGALERRGRWDG